MIAQDSIHLTLKDKKCSRGKSRHFPGNDSGFQQLFLFTCPHPPTLEQMFPFFSISFVYSLQSTFFPLYQIETLLFQTILFRFIELHFLHLSSISSCNLILNKSFCNYVIICERNSKVNNHWVSWSRTLYKCVCERLHLSFHIRWRTRNPPGLTGLSVNTPRHSWDCLGNNASLYCLRFRLLCVISRLYSFS